MMDIVLTPQSYDGVVSALTGNGTLCTTVCPTGYHTPPELVDDTSHRTQHFVMAGRRRSGPQHPLVNFGTLSRTLRVDREPPKVREWKQTLDVDNGIVLSEWTYQELEEKTRSCVLLQDNVFLADTVIHNTSDRELEIVAHIRYAFGEPDAVLTHLSDEGGRRMEYCLEDHLGSILFRSLLVAGAGELDLDSDGPGSARLTSRLPAGTSVVLSTWVHFSDRLRYETAVDEDEIEAAVERHERGWREFWSRSEVETGDETVDAFRKTSLYTLRCQCTPWSVPATLSSPYWGGGAFHDEMYPFFGLLSSNYPDLAERIPYFRLATLPRAQQRARGRGALYPWSSTELGEERDPHGHWLTERFHLGQFAACIRALFLYEQNVFQLEDLYPALRELARYFELEMLERDANGRLGTRACTDFDESVGKVKNGPFTLCAAISTMEFAAEAARTLSRDLDRGALWASLAAELRETHYSGSTDGADEIYSIPDGKALHYSILGPVFPFGVDVTGPRAVRSASHIHEVCRSTMGWKPGFSEVFDGHNWMWMAGHLGIVHALQENAAQAWEAVRGGPASAGAFLSPNEHRNREGRVVVPWFTTGCGAWLYALNAMFVQVDRQGTKLLPAAPRDLPALRFRDLRAEGGVVVSAKLEGTTLVSLSVRAPREMPWRYRIPERFAESRSLLGNRSPSENGWLSCAIERLPANEEVSLLV